MDEIHKQNVEWKKPDLKDCRMCDSTWAKLLYGARSQNSSCPWVSNCAWKETQGGFWVQAMLLPNLGGDSMGL